MKTKSKPSKAAKGGGRAQPACGSMLIPKSPESNLLRCVNCPTEVPSAGLSPPHPAGMDRTCPVCQIAPGVSCLPDRRSDGTLTHLVHVLRTTAGESPPNDSACDKVCSYPDTGNVQLCPCEGACRRCSIALNHALTSARTGLDIALAALEGWACDLCTGTKVVPAWRYDSSLNVRPKPTVPCRACEATGIHPLARHALSRIRGG